MKTLPAALSILTLTAMAASEAVSALSPAERRRQQLEEQANADIAPTNPNVKSGLSLRVRGRKVVIGSGQIQVGDRLVDVAQPTKVIVPPSGPLSVNDDILRFSDGGKPTDTLVLPKCRAALNDNAILRGILVPNSLKLKASPGSDSPPLKAESDYVLDRTLGAVKLLPSASIKPGDKAYADYQCWRRRIDTIAFDPATQHFVLVQGVPARSGPEPPVLEQLLIPIANIYSEWADRDIPATNVLPIAESEYKPGNDFSQHNKKALLPVMKKLESGQPVHVVFWGDATVQGYDARTREDTFVHRFIKALKTRYPKSNINVSNLGINGSDSSKRLASLKQEVFSLKPDLLVVSFVNDFALPAHSLQQDYEQVLDLAKEKGASVILCTPHAPSPRVAKAKDYESIADRPYVPILRELAEKNDFVALSDVFARWQHLPQEGLRSDMLMVNGTSNPNNRGHEMYAEELIRCFMPNLPVPTPHTASTTDGERQADATTH